MTSDQSGHFGKEESSAYGLFQFAPTAWRPYVSGAQPEYTQYVDLEKGTPVRVQKWPGDKMWWKGVVRNIAYDAEAGTVTILFISEDLVREQLKAAQDAAKYLR